jgi:hypothetical protein
LLTLPLLSDRLAQQRCRGAALGIKTKFFSDIFSILSNLHLDGTIKLVAAAFTLSFSLNS